MFSTKTKPGMVIYLILLFAFLSSFSSDAQTTWAFGKRAGIHFPASGNPVAQSFLPAQFNVEGIAGYNDKAGNLQFFSDGITLRDKNWQICPNGNGLLGDSSCSQSAIFVDYPGDTNQVILFVVDAWGDQPNPLNPGEQNKGLSYSVINKTLNNVKGDIVTNKKNIILKAPIQEKIAVYPKSDCIGYWVVIVGSGAESTRFFTYSVGPDGIGATPVVSEVSFQHNNPIGEMEISSDGQHLAYTNFIGNLVGLFDFNTATGQVSNPRRIDFNNTLGSPYGLEFSPDGKSLFIGCTYFNNAVFKVNLNTFTLQNLEEISNLFIQGYEYGQLATGPDQNIYLARNMQSHIACIKNPDSEDPVFVEDAISLNPHTFCRMGLPTTFRDFPKVLKRIESLLDYSCALPTPVRFRLLDSTGITSALWNFGNGSTSNLINPTYPYSKTGNFLVSVTFKIQGSACSYSLTDSVKISGVQVLSNPILNQIPNLCSSEAVASFSVPDSSLFDYAYWEFGDNETGTGMHVVHEYNSTGTFFVHLTVKIKSDTCVFHFNNTLTIDPNENIIELEILPESVLENCQQASTLLHFSPKAGFEYTWDFGINYPKLITTLEKEITPPYKEVGTYQVKIRSKSPNGCEGNQTRSVIVPGALFPNLITPNNDTHNEAFVVPFPEQIDHIQIFNRWGGRLFNETEYKNDWSPIDKNESVYFYSIHYKGSFNCSGWIQNIK